MKNGGYAPLLENARQQLGALDLEKARDALQECSSIFLMPPDPGKTLVFWRDAASAFRSAGMPEEAERCWVQARAKGMPESVAETEIASGFVLAGRFADVEKRLEILRQQQPKNAVVCNLRAIQLFEAGKRHEALDEWEACLRISAQTDCPLSTHPSYLSLGAMAIERYLLEQDAAILEAGKASPLTPQKAPGRTLGKRLRKIETAWSEGQYAQALAWVEGEPQEGKDSDDLCMVRAMVLGSLARWDDARREITSFLRRDPQNGSALSFLAYALVHSSEPRVALSVLRRVAPAGPDDFFANYISGCAWMAMGDRPRSALAFQSGFQSYFFDSYHSVLVPAWHRALRLLRQEHGAA